MQTFIFAAYILVWPVVTLGVLAVICRATLRDMRAAKRENRELV